MGRSTARALRGWPAFRPRCWSQSPCVSSTKRDAGLDEAPGQQALAAEVGGRRVVEAVQALRRRRLAREVHDAGELALHAEGELVGLDDPLDAGVNPLAFEQVAVHRLDEVELEALGRRRRAGGS